MGSSLELLICPKTLCSRHVELESCLTSVLFISFLYLNDDLTFKIADLICCKHAIAKSDFYYRKCILSGLVLGLGACRFSGKKSRAP